MTRPQWTEADERFMRRAIELSRRGFPAPNPHVGCVIVRDGQIVGEGWHTHAGSPHAEAAALTDAAGAAQGADAYVTLEPCNHTGRTPPCAKALLDQRIRKVFIACSDPNPKAAGGAEFLRSAGVEIHEGLLQQEAAEANRQFLHAMKHRRPLVVVKAAMSLDGRIALPSGESKWITSEQARREGHLLRAELGAVLVGRGTVEADDPQLTARIDGIVNQPVRIVLDPSNRLTGKEQVFNQAAETIHVNKPFEIPALLKDLFTRGITGILVEGGPTTISRFIEADLVDRYELFVAPKLLGDGPAWINLQIETLNKAKTLEFKAITRVGPDLRITAEPAAE